MEDNIENSVCGDEIVDMLQAGLTDSVQKELEVQVWLHHSITVIIISLSIEVLNQDWSRNRDD